MTTNLPGRPTKAVMTGMKVVLVSASIAGSIGIWGVLSEKAMLASVKDVSGDNESPDANSVAMLPTLTNILVVDTKQTIQFLPTPTAGPDLRNVAAMPTPTAIAAPDINTVVVGVPVSSGGGGGGAKTKAKPKTRSS